MLTSRLSFWRARRTREEVPVTRSAGPLARIGRAAGLARALTVRQTAGAAAGYVHGVRLVVVAIVLPFTAMLVAGCGGGGQAAEAETAPKTKFQGHAVTTPAPDFTLRDARGQEVSLSSQRGRLVRITFLYTNCPDVCPLIAENLNRALRQLGPERSEVRVLAVSVDPKGDTAKAVRAYEKLHHLVPEFRYLIGSRKELEAVWAEYKVTAVASDPELVDHVAYTLLVDRSGKGRVLYGSSVRSAQVAHDVRVLLAA